MSRVANSHRLRIGVITSGVSGISLAAALRACQHTIMGVSFLDTPMCVGGVREGAETCADSEALTMADRLDAMLPNASLKEPTQLIEESDVVLLCVSAAWELRDFLEHSEEKSLWRRGQLVIHTAPDAGASLCDTAADRGAFVIAMHPAIEFTGTSLDIERLHGAYWALDAAPLVLPIGEAIVMDLGGEARIVEDSVRGDYTKAIRVATTTTHTLAREIRTLLRNAHIDDDSYAWNLMEHSLREGLRGSEEL
ncbi:hypothetical protein [Actinotignum urinale]|uniref:Putative oxidoreductase/dehydrogenase Rossmann-like domain-containing protein n=1 Tax=Actinotignum urinale TaxID=190146 RepID=A0AAW9HRB2_9ACTO|nr:hypothetical protein [Actinotignum urinale]MDY5155207.1 hypothetical protein [Actinotignum urinale]